MQEPSIGRIVVYRNHQGVDMPAIITALTDDPEYVHLHLFVPPGHQPDVLSYQYGTPRADAGEPAELLAGCWRWPERPSAADAINAALKPDPEFDARVKQAAARAKRAKPDEGDDAGA